MSPLEGFARLVRKLPAQPPSMLLAAALDLALRPQLTPAHKKMLHQRVVLVAVSDLGIECRVAWSGTRFVAYGRGCAHDIAVRARLRDFHALATQREDADTLFFQRRLVIDGDTALGLGIKNLLDGITMPDWLARLLPPLRQSQGV